jgi:hypothetical protein
MIVFNAGAGDRLFAGGSFTSIAGAQRRALASWNPATNTWSDVGGGVFTQFTSSFVAALHAADLALGDATELLVGGNFGTAGGQPNSNHLARWNGTRWAGFPGGQPNSAVWSIASFQGQIFIGGGFTSVGTTVANGIARWDSEGAWQPVGSGMGGGFSPTVFVMRTFNDGSGEKLYVAGRYASIGGVTGMIARWTGSTWENVGGGISPAGGNVLANIESMAVFDDGSGPALYVGGYDLLPAQSPMCSVAKWDGVRWHAVGQYLGGRTTSLAVFNDGTGPALYAGGTAQPGINYVARLQNNQWVTLSGGVGQPGGPPWPSVFGLLAWNDRLFVAGDFDYVGAAQMPASGIAVWRGCAPPPTPCDPDVNCDGNVDQDDIACLTQAVGGNSSCICTNPDFNRDGNVDQDDIDALAQVVGGAPCP